MDLVRLHEVTVADRDGGLTAGIVVAPHRHAEGVLWDGSRALKELIGREEFAWVPYPELLPSALGMVVLGEEDFRKDARSPSGDFVSALAFGEMVPIEESPLRPTSLASVVSIATATSGTAAVAHVSGEPLLLVLTPVMVIVMGAATGISQALNVGLRYKLLRYMGVPTDTDEFHRTARRLNPDE
jgi:hypothetical protein